MSAFFPFLSSVQTFVLYHTPVYGIFASKIWVFYFVQNFFDTVNPLISWLFSEFFNFSQKKIKKVLSSVFENVLK